MTQTKEEIKKEAKKEYNKQYMVDYNKVYREKNRERLNEKKREVVECPCGLSYTKSNKWSHLRGSNHIYYVSECEEVEK
jgi:hypothetical protein